MKTINNLFKKLSVARKLTWLSYLLLIVALAANSLTRGQPLFVLAFTVLPLLIFIPGMIKERYKSLSLLCFVTLFYFVIIVNNLFASNRNGFDMVELVLVICLYSASMLFSRWKQYSLYQEEPSEPQQSQSNHSAG